MSNLNPPRNNELRGLRFWGSFGYKGKNFSKPSRKINTVNKNPSEISNGRVKGDKRKESDNAYVLWRLGMRFQDPRKRSKCSWSGDTLNWIGEKGTGEDRIRRGTQHL